jgi:trans-AT polyketide synthase/acyltransferase/oxidoreductase domain-containing protein
MGKDLFGAYPEFVQTADDLLGYSMVELCTRNPEGRLDRTEYTQPALFVVSALAYFKHVESTHLLPRALIGHSLGEYTALFAAAVLDFRTALALVRERGRLMSLARDGGMAAVLGMSAERVQEIIAAKGLAGVWVGNANAPEQTVITGDRQAVLEAKSVFEGAGASRVVPLPVSGAFHSPLMDEARREFRKHLAEAKFQRIRVPVMSNVTARFHDPGALQEVLAQQITAPVLWMDCIRFLMEHGADEFVELGPGQVLTKLVSRIRVASAAAA